MPSREEMKRARKLITVAENPQTGGRMWEPAYAPPGTLESGEVAYEVTGIGTGEGIPAEPSYVQAVVGQVTLVFVQALREVFQEHRHLFNQNYRPYITEVLASPEEKASGYDYHAIYVTIPAKAHEDMKREIFLGHGGREIP